MIIATSDVQFCFDNIIFSQKDGVAMGSPLGPTFANIFVGSLESKLAEDLLSHVIYIRYVENCLVKSKTVSDNKAIF